MRHSIFLQLCPFCGEGPVIPTECLGKVLYPCEECDLTWGQPTILKTEESVGTASQPESWGGTLTDPYPNCSVLFHADQVAGLTHEDVWTIGEALKPSERWGFGPLSSRAGSSHYIRKEGSDVRFHQPSGTLLIAGKTIDQTTGEEDPMDNWAELASDLATADDIALLAKNSGRWGQERWAIALNEATLSV